MLYWILLVLIGCVDEVYDLNTVKKLDSKAIRIIEQWSPTEDRLQLNGLTSLTVKDAAILASWHPRNNLIKLSDEMIERLTPTSDEYLDAKGELLSVKLLEYVDTPRLSLRGSYPKLELNGLTTLTPEIAKEFAQAPLQLEIFLNGVRSIDAKTMHALANGSRYGRLYFDGLETMPPAVAAEIEWLHGGHFTGVYLSFRGVKEWSVESLVALQAWSGESLTLKPDVLTVEQARALVGLQLMSLDIENSSCVTPQNLEILKDAPFFITIEDHKQLASGYETTRRVYTMRNGTVETYDENGLLIEEDSNGE